ncbi:transferrin receptor-like dimerization domain-containing protein [Phenylobacterium sp.]|uniref:transferrin receptor-like dimerization domain-containing protein n=1 Tax=Phenylobacterium sp. TaxID=1871053 RepID=UPI0035AFD225
MINLSKRPLIALIIAAGLAAPMGASVAQAKGPPTDLNASFDAKLSADDQRDWMKLMAAEPNHVGSPHDKFLAEFQVEQFRKWGWDARIETFEVLFPTPISETVEMLGPKPFTATLQEKPIPGDTSATAKDPALPAYLAYQGDGDVTAPLVYVNYGTPEDYKDLERMGVSVKGKIVIARYGKVWRGLKPRLAQDHGAIGCIIYSDPADDGYAQEAVYPDGPMRPPQGIQRGSAMDMMIYPGDPLTPGVGATKDAKRLTRETAASVLKIPALPISYGDAQVLMAAMDGQVVPESWRGALPITYRVGSGGPPVHLAVKSDWSLKPVYDVIATLKGSTWPDQWVVRGNHHDGWVFGAGDPLSGQVALMDEAKALGALVKAGWKPKRTIVYTSWDGEEPMLLGSTEWAETHADELKEKAIIYINTDGNGRGYLHASGHPDLAKFITTTAATVTDPETNAPVTERARARLMVEAAAPGAPPSVKAMAKAAADPSSALPLGPLGSGSDYSSFADHLGVATLNLGFGGETPGGGVYHSRYDTFEHQSKFMDPGFVYGKVLSQTVGHAVIAAADSTLPLQDPADMASTMARYVGEVEKLADTKREAAQAQAKLLADHAFELASDPTLSHADPTPLKPVPAFDFAPLDTAVAGLTKSAEAYNAALAAKGAGLSAAKAAKLQAIMGSISQTLLNDKGLPGRPWYKNMIDAPGRYSGYGAKTLPGVREAIEQERWDDVTTYIGVTADALKAYAARLDEATALLNQA